MLKFSLYFCCLTYFPDFATGTPNLIIEKRKIQKASKKHIFTVSNVCFTSFMHYEQKRNCLNSLISKMEERYFIVMIFFLGTFGLTQKYPKSQENISRNFAQATP